MFGFEKRRMVMTAFLQWAKNNLNLFYLIKIENILPKNFFFVTLSKCVADNGRHPEDFFAKTDYA